MASSLIRRRLLPAAAAVVLAGVAYSCAGGKAGSGLTASDAATRVYVAPGSYDEMYAFMSGGFNGQVGVYGLPSGRRFKTIPVFSQYPENGYGYSEETKPMLNTSYGFVPWDDAHHPALSQTKGEDDGRWLFINGNNTPRVARIDLTRMETDEILEIPNAAGNHGSPFITENSEYVVASTRFSVPVPNRDVPIADYKKDFNGQVSFVVANDPGKMRIAFQLVMPGYDYDLAHAGKGPSHGWMFLTSYNTEQANSLLEVNASQNDKDFVAAINWKNLEACVKAGKARQVPATYYHNTVDSATRIAHSTVENTVTQLTPKDCPNSTYFLPTPKSPHGVNVDPTGEYIAAGGKLAALIPVHSFSKMIKAIEAKDFDGERDGIPVLKYESTLVGEVKSGGLGPLHTEFDDKGFAYTSFFISSEIVKWKVSSLEVVDRVPAYYSIGHLLVPGGGTSKPTGRYVIALNKITKDRYLGTGPELTQSAQLYDITGPKMKLLLDFPTEGEPHYAQAILASKIKDRQVKYFKLADNKHPNVSRSENETGVTRQGKVVHLRLTAIRSHFAPDNIEGIMLGDTVMFHVTNLEQDWDIPHGLGIMGNNNAELLIMPGETRTLRWVPQRVGIYPFYCTDFCSALHQEMQGYLRVSPPGSNVPLKGTLSKLAKTADNAAKK